MQNMHLLRGQDIEQLLILAAMEGCVDVAQQALLFHAEVATHHVHHAALISLLHFFPFLQASLLTSSA
jgi:hypothetical protein